MKKSFFKKKPKKMFSVEERFVYHNDRYLRSAKNGLKFGGIKHSYSMGFVDAFSGRDNTLATRHEFGDKSANAYSRGYKIGRKAVFDYYRDTGKIASDLPLKYH